MANEAQIHDLLMQVLGRLADLEAEGKDTQNKLDALARRVSLPPTPISISLRDSAGEMADLIPPSPAPDAEIEASGWNDCERKSPGEFARIPSTGTSAREAEIDSLKPNPPKPRLGIRHRAKKVDIRQAANVSSLAFDEESLNVMRGLFEILLSNAAGAVPQSENRARLPIQRSGNFVLRTIDEEGQSLKSRVLEFELQDSLAHLSRDADRRRPRLVTAAAIVMLGLLFGGGLIVGHGLSPRLSTKADEAQVPVPKPPFNPRDSRNALEQFLGSGSLEEAVAHVHAQDGQTIGRMREYYARPGNEGWHGEILDNSPVGSMVSGGRTFHLWRVQTPGGFVRIAPLYQADRRIRLYWEGFTGYGAMGWDCFVKNRPQEPVEMRVILGRVSNTFVLKGDALVLEVSHPDSDIAEIVNVTDETLRMLVEGRLPGSSKPIRAMVKMAYIPDASGDKRLRMTSFIGTGWGEDLLSDSQLASVAAQD